MKNDTVEFRLANLLEAQLKRRPTREHPFRHWRFDLAYPSIKLAIEINGRSHLRHGRHRKDCEKINAAIAAGWRVLQYPASCVLTKKRCERIVEQIARVVCSEYDYNLDDCVLTGD